MSKSTSRRLVCLLGLITFSLVWLMPQVNYEEAQHLFIGVICCSVIAAYLIKLG